MVENVGGARLRCQVPFTRLKRLRKSVAFCVSVTDRFQIPGCIRAQFGRTEISNVESFAVHRSTPTTSRYRAPPAREPESRVAGARSTRMNSQPRLLPALTAQSPAARASQTKRGRVPRKSSCSIPTSRSLRRALDTAGDHGITGSCRISNRCGTPSHPCGTGETQCDTPPTISGLCLLGHRRLDLPCT